jgi:hypothetical protein
MPASKAADSEGAVDLVVEAVLVAGDSGAVGSEAVDLAGAALTSIARMDPYITVSATQR